MIYPGGENRVKGDWGVLQNFPVTYTGGRRKNLLNLCRKNCEYFKAQWKLFKGSTVPFLDVVGTF
jgi:hypothetical protein